MEVSKKETCPLVHEWNRASRRLAMLVEQMGKIDREFEYKTQLDAPEEVLRQNVEEYQKLDKEAYKLLDQIQEIEHAMDNDSLSEVHPVGYRTGYVQAKKAVKCGAVKERNGFTWVATHPACRPGTCLHDQKEIARRHYVRAWCKS